nr:hybrid signal transduction histidine kinase M [Tanacetum cinerariifolium]
MVDRSLNVNNDPFRPREENKDVIDPEVPNLSAIGALMYLTNCTRPDTKIQSISRKKGIGMESSTYSDTFMERLRVVEDRFHCSILDLHNSRQIPSITAVVADPQTAKEAWDLLAEIFQDNKRNCFIALKAKLSSLKLGDLSIDAYFPKIESIATILTSLCSPISNDDIVTFALKGLPHKYDNISGIIIHYKHFLDLKKLQSMLTTEEMRFKSKDQATSVDSTSSSLMVLLANSAHNTQSVRSSGSFRSGRPAGSFGYVGTVRYCILIGYLEVEMEYVGHVYLFFR